MLYFSKFEFARWRHVPFFERLKRNYQKEDTEYARINSVVGNSRKNSSAPRREKYKVTPEMCSCFPIFSFFFFFMYINKILNAVRHQCLSFSTQYKCIARNLNALGTGVFVSPRRRQYNIVGRYDIINGPWKRVTDGSVRYRPAEWKYQKSNPHAVYPISARHIMNVSIRFVLIC